MREGDRAGDGDGDVDIARLGYDDTRVEDLDRPRSRASIGPWRGALARALELDSDTALGTCAMDTHTPLPTTGGRSREWLAFFERRG